MKVLNIAFLALISLSSTQAFSEITTVGPVDLLCEKDGVRVNVLYVGSGMRSQDIQQNSYDGGVEFYDGFNTTGVFANLSISENNSTLKNKEWLSSADQFLNKAGAADFYYDTFGIGRVYVDDLDRTIELRTHALDDGGPEIDENAYDKMMLEFTSQLGAKEVKVLGVNLFTSFNGFLDFNKNATNYTLYVKALHNSGILEFNFSQEDCKGIVSKAE